MSIQGSRWHRPFAPSYGQVQTYNVPGTRQPRRIVHSLTFPMEAVGDVDGDGDKDESPFERNNALDHGYEHDFPAAIEFARRSPEPDPATVTDGS